MNVIKQIVDDTGTNTIKMIVRSNERGPQGEQGIPGEAATIEAGQAYSVPASQSPAVINTGTDSAAKFDFYIPKGEKGEPGKDGSFQYKAGVGIDITDGTISLVGGSTGAGIWGLIAGNISDQTDLQTEFAKYTPTANLATVATTGAYSDLTGTPNLATVATSGSYTDLTNKPNIPSAGSARHLTLANYNWPSMGQKKGIALWLLSPGTYYYDSSVAIYESSTWADPVIDGAATLLVSEANGALNATKFRYDGTIYISCINKTTGVATFTDRKVLSVHDITDNLTSSSTTTALSAKQGKVLKDALDALVIPTITMQTTDPGEGAALAANNFIAVYSA